MTKEINVSGRVPMSVRRQVRDARNRGHVRRTIKNKTLKKIKIPSHQKQPIPTTKKIEGDKLKGEQTGGKKSILKRTKHKTMKQVRFHLGTDNGVQIGKFRNAKRVKMKTAKNDRGIKHNQTLKTKNFKIRYNEPKVQETEHQFKGNLLNNLKTIKKELTGDTIISRV